MARPKAPPAERQASLVVRAICVAGCVASPVATLFHEGAVGAAFGILGYGGLIAVTAREHPGELREEVSPFAFWIAVGVMVFLGAYVLAKHT